MPGPEMEAVVRVAACVVNCVAQTLGDLLGIHQFVEQVIGPQRSALESVVIHRVRAAYESFERVGIWLHSHSHHLIQHLQMSPKRTRKRVSLGIVCIAIEGNSIERMLI